jgi:P-type conjugative transfer protein TrbG
MTPLRPHSTWLGLAVVLATGGLLSGCNGTMHDPGAEASFLPATAEAPPPEPEVIAVEVPVPVPGNLKELPPRALVPKPVSATPKSPTAIVSTANSQARQTPNLHGYLNAIQVYDYMPGALYQVYAAPGFVTTIALQQGEEIITVAAGDTVRWVIGDTVSGEGAAAQSLVLLKPIKPQLQTNVVISTSFGRVYTLEATSLDGNVYNAAVAWNYPHDDLAKIRKTVAQQRQRDGQTIASGISVENLNFGYAISGDSPRWRPTQVFDDGRKTYIQFPPNLGTTEAPPLFVLGGNGDAQLVNYRIRANYYEIDRLIDAAELRLGEKPQTVVRIERTGLPGIPQPPRDPNPAQSRETVWRGRQ